MEGVLGGHATDWEPPLAEEIEPCFPGYTDFEFIDRGGMGAVYAATQVSLDRRVAFKILPPDLGQDTLFVDSFHHEARLLARLQHPHIVAIYDFGRNALGHLFIVMEYVEGMSLLDVLKRETLPIPRVLDILSEVCEALQFAHDHQVIHRDIKPTNILIDNRGRVRVADFGLAKLATKEAPTTTAGTRSTFVMGTPVYAAPEQRQPNANADHRSDIFSVGITFYEMLTGRIPTGVFEPASQTTGSPPILDNIITKTLRECPTDRYQSAEELRIAIRKAADRITKPFVQHTIAERPMISMMTTVIVTSGLIYLFGEINTILTQNKPITSSASAQSNSLLVHLDDTYSVINSRMTWEQARRQAAASPGMELASFHSAEEVARVVALLREKGIRSPVWTGGWRSDPDTPFKWTDGSTFDFESWMPSSSSQPVIITEVQAKNRTTLRTASGDTPDWVEVYNPGSQPVNLRGWQLRHTTGGRITGGWLGGEDSTSSPDDLIIQPGEYRVITCYPLANATGLHLDFQLEAQVGRLAWIDPRGKIIQSFNRNWEEFPADASLISDTHGMKWSWASKPTPGAPNPPQESLIDVSAVPPPAQSEAVVLMTEFEGNWALEGPYRSIPPLVRSTRR